jgi:transcriptional regulator of arginine metabolism
MHNYTLKLNKNSLILNIYSILRVVNTQVSLFWVTIKFMTIQSKSLLDTLRLLLTKGSGAHTQEDIKQGLEQAGFEVNQSKISRLLRKLSAIKAIDETTGKAVYRLSFEPSPPSSQASLNNLVIDVVRNEQLIVIRTSPGAASLIARMLDHDQESLNILGSVAGDDTILVIPSSLKLIDQSFKAIKDKLYGVMA